MACPVCFGGDDPMMRESLNAGIGVLLGVTAIVLGCFARFFVSLARRSRESAHLVGAVTVPSHGGTPGRAGLGDDEGGLQVGPHAPRAQGAI
jgi:hypothetical protein